MCVCVFLTVFYAFSCKWCAFAPHQHRQTHTHTCDNFHILHGNCPCERARTPLLTWLNVYKCIPEIWMSPVTSVQCEFILSTNKLGECYNRREKASKKKGERVCEFEKLLRQETSQLLFLLQNIIFDARSEWENSKRRRQRLFLKDFQLKSFLFIFFSVVAVAELFTVSRPVYKTV